MCLYIIIKNFFIICNFSHLMHFLKFQYADRPVFINQFLSLIGGPRIKFYIFFIIFLTSNFHFLHIKNLKGEPILLIYIIFCEICFIHIQKKIMYSIEVCQL